MSYLDALIKSEIQKRIEFLQQVVAFLEPFPSSEAKIAAHTELEALNWVVKLSTPQ